MNKFIANIFGLLLAILRAFVLILFILALYGVLSSTGNEISNELQGYGIFGPAVLVLIFIVYVIVAGTLSVHVSKHEQMIKQSALLEEIITNQQSIIRKLDHKEPLI